MSSLTTDDVTSIVHGIIPVLARLTKIQSAAVIKIIQVVTRGHEENRQLQGRALARYPSNTMPLNAFRKPLSLVAANTSGPTMHHCQSLVPLKALQTLSIPVMRAHLLNPVVCLLVVRRWEGVPVSH